MPKKFSIILRESWMIFGMNFNSLNPMILKEALKQVYSVINDLQENPAILFTSKKTKVFAFSIWIKIYSHQLWWPVFKICEQSHLW